MIPTACRLLRLLPLSARDDHVDSDYYDDGRRLQQPLLIRHVVPRRLHHLATTDCLRLPTADDCCLQRAVISHLLVKYFQMITSVMIKYRHLQQA